MSEENPKKLVLESVLETVRAIRRGKKKELVSAALELETEFDARLNALLAEPGPKPKKAA